MDLQTLLPSAWTAGVLGMAAFILYAVGGVIDSVDLTLLVLGAAPVGAFGMVVFGWSPQRT